MARAATRSPSLKPIDRPEGGPAPLHQGWAPTRPLAPVRPAAEPAAGDAPNPGTRHQAPTPGAPREAATMSRTPKSTPPLKGQTGPRPGY